MILKLTNEGPLTLQLFEPKVENSKYRYIHYTVVYTGRQGHILTCRAAKPLNNFK